MLPLATSQHHPFIKSLIHLCIQLSSDRPRFLCSSTFTYSLYLPFNNKMEVPNYCGQTSLLFCKERIKNPPSVATKKGYVPKAFEHHVGSWALTMLKSVFQGDQWIITPEKTDQHSNKRPDLVVEKVTSDTDSKHHLFMELKAKPPVGDRIEEALAQVVHEIEETLEYTIEAYVVVQRGTKIAFFEYHNDVSNLDEEDIPHYKGCVSLTQTYILNGVNSVVMNNLPDDLDLLYHEFDHLRKETDNREEASAYSVPCVFDLDKHEREINFLFHYMANNEPRSSVWV